MTATKTQPTIRLTARGEALVKKAREEREENIRRNNGEYKPDPWYRGYLPKDFVIPEQKPSNISETDMEAYELLDKLTRSKSNRKRNKEDSEDMFEEDRELDNEFSDDDSEDYEDDDE